MAGKLSYAVVGCGAAGMVHAYHFSRHPSIRCCAAVDVSVERTALFKKHFGFDGCYAQLNDALEDEKIDIVSIATPPVFHAEQVAAAARRGVHVLSEKPLFLNEREASWALSICKEHSVMLGVMLPRRFYNNSRAVRIILDDGGLGRIECATFDLRCRKEKAYYDCWRGKKEYVGGGILMSQALHSLDQLVYFFGKPASVEGRVWRERDYIDVEDEAKATIQFESDVRVDIRASNNSFEHDWKGITEIVGSEGRVVLDSEAVVLWDAPSVPLPAAEEDEIVPECYKPRYYGPGHLKVIQNFIGAVEGRESLWVSGHDAMDALRLIWGIYDSSREGISVTIGEG